MITAGVVSVVRGVVGVGPGVLTAQVLHNLFDLLVVDPWHRFHQTSELLLKVDNLGWLPRWLQRFSFAGVDQHVLEEAPHPVHHDVGLLIRAPLVETVFSGQLAPLAALFADVTLVRLLPRRLVGSYR